MSLVAIAERGHLPDALVRAGIRRLLRQRLRAIGQPDCETEQKSRETFLEHLRESPIALHTDDANEQHYELPAKFFELVLGRHLKYSCCEWSPDCNDLDTAEAAMLARTAERAELGNGQRVLELGCGWGSLTLWAAERHRDSSFLAVSNSSGQRTFIERAARERGLDNVRVVTADMNEFEPEGTFDRIVSVEMFEHMRNVGLMHLACLAVLWVGWSVFAVTVAVVAYFVRMFAITAFYHRYFSHRAFRTSRASQLVFAVAGASAVQRGPLWWAAHHRYHHAHADRASDIHSPRRQGLLWSHLGWLAARRNYRTRLETVRDLARYPELRFLDRFDTLVPVLFAAALYAGGSWLEGVAPQLGVTGPQLLVWGFFISTVILYHATFTINSLAHRFGRRRYATSDDSRNNLFLALLTLGEGWHNNHHHCPASARQGFFWWEVDVSYYLLLVLECLGLVWDVKRVSSRVQNAGRERLEGVA